MTCSLITRQIVLWSTSGACWVETTTVWTRTGFGALVLDGHLALAVGPQPGDRAVLRAAPSGG